jgi:hypothetical protein
MLTKIAMCRQILVKLQNIKFNENMFSNFRVVKSGRQTGMTKLIGAFLQLFVRTRQKWHCDGYGTVSCKNIRNMAKNVN